jgi:hypothetical protein
MGFFDCLPSSSRTRQRLETRRSGTELPKKSLVTNRTSSASNLESDDKHNSNRRIPFRRSTQPVKSGCSTQTMAVTTHLSEWDVPPPTAGSTTTTANKDDDFSSMFLTIDPLSEKGKLKRQQHGDRRAKFLLEQVEQCKEVESVLRGERFRQANGLEWSNSSSCSCDQPL